MVAVELFVPVTEAKRIFHDELIDWRCRIGKKLVVYHFVCAIAKQLCGMVLYFAAAYMLHVTRDESHCKTSNQISRAKPGSGLPSSMSLAAIVMIS